MRVLVAVQIVWGLLVLGEVCIIGWWEYADYLETP